MSETTSDTDVCATSETETLTIERIYTGTCPSLSQRSTLSYAVGRYTDTQQLCVQLTGNTARGMFAKDWIEASRIDGLVQGATALTSKHLQQLYAGKSINSGGFLLAILKHVGLVLPNPENSRLCIHVPGQTFETAMQAHIDSASTTRASKRKAKETKEGN